MTITRLLRVLGATAAILLATVLTGCYENFEPEPQASTPPPAQTPVATDPTNAPRPGLSASKRAAENTAQKVDQHQRRLEEIMEEDQ